MTTTETFTETLKPGNIQISVTIERTPADVSDLNTSARMNPDRAPKCCAAELYARAAGKPWGV